MAVRVFRSLAASLVVLAFAVTADAGAERELPSVPAGFTIEAIANVPHPRELAATPNGDLIVGTLGRDVYVVPAAEGTPQTPAVFAHLDGGEAAGVALADGTLFVGTTFGVWKVPYHAGDRIARAAPAEVFAVRTGGGGGHSTTSVAVSGATLYVGVGSSCNACEESDPTRAAVTAMTLDGTNPAPRAIRIRNAIALATDRVTGRVWAGVAGQDELERGHPYEIFDALAAPGTARADYGWPVCYENRRAVNAGTDCSAIAVPRVVFPAYETPIGATFAPERARGRYAFPPAWSGGAFVTLHGSWHRPLVPPRVAFVRIAGDRPATPVDWNDPAKQWSEFAGAWQREDGRRIGRPTGIVFGSEGSLFIADDESDTIYRIRPVVERSSASDRS